MITSWIYTTMAQGIALIFQLKHKNVRKHFGHNRGISDDPMLIAHISYLELVRGI